MSSVSPPTRTSSAGSSSSSSSGSSNTASPSLFSSSDDQNASDPSTSSLATPTTTPNTTPNNSSKESGSESPVPTSAGAYAVRRSLEAFHPSGLPLPVSVRVNARHHDLAEVQRQVEAALASYNLSNEASRKQFQRGYATRERFRPADDVLQAGVDRLRLGDARRKEDEAIGALSGVTDESVRHELARAREDIFASRNADFDPMIDAIIHQHLPSPSQYADDQHSRVPSLRSASSSDTISPSHSLDSAMVQPQPLSFKKSNLYDSFGFVPSSDMEGVTPTNAAASFANAQDA